MNHDTTKAAIIVTILGLLLAAGCLLAGRAKALNAELNRSAEQRATEYREILRGE